jgi:choline dehydrogenase
MLLSSARPGRSVTVYDYVIVGGGSAGSALANRLSADPSTRVLVLEAGRPDYRWDVFIHMPAALTFPIGSRFYDWRYESEPEPFLNGRRISHARGKVLGGSSSINGMIFQRGNPLDYERWAADPGMETWGYAHCLPYFKKMENCLAADSADEFHGHSGPLEIERGPATNPLFGAFFEAVQQAGYPITDDVNGFRQEGFAAFDRNVRRGRRLSAARAYLRPVMHRPNLTVTTRALVHRVVFDGRRAVGVDYSTRRGGTLRVAAGEVVLCGGAFNSPQLLQLSGVGDRAKLTALGLPVVQDLPAVGRHMQDHLEVYVQYSCKQPVSLQPQLRLWRRALIGAEWLFLRKGPGASNHFEGGGFVRSNGDVRYPNLMFHFLPIAIRYDGSSPSGGHGYQVHVGPMYSNSRGSVTITSTDPRTKPALRFNYISTRGGPPRVGRGDPHRPPDPDPARDGNPSTAASSLRGHLSRPTIRSSTGFAMTARPPSIRRARAAWDWLTTTAWSTRDDARARSGQRSRGRRVGDALRHQRQHLRTRDDDG